MSLYDDTNPNHIAYLHRWRAAAERAWRKGEGVREAARQKPEPAR